MVTLVPALDACVSRMTNGERRLAERLEQKLDDDHLLWYDAPAGHKRLQPDFSPGPRHHHQNHHRSTLQILQIANAIAGDLLAAEDRDNDAISLAEPFSCGRDGPEPIAINLPTPTEQAAKMAELLPGARADGCAWGDMAVPCRDGKARDLCASTFAKQGMPVQHRLGERAHCPFGG